MLCVLLTASTACTALNAAFGDEEAGEAAGGTSSTTRTSEESGPSGTGKGSDSVAGSSSGHGTADSTSGTTTPAPTDDETGIDSESTGSDDPGFECRSEAFEVQLTASEIDCESLMEDAVVQFELQCMQLSFSGNELEGTPATGCGLGSCETTAGGPTLTASVEGVDLAGAMGTPPPGCGFVWASGRESDGDCQWANLSLFRVDASIAVMLGNGITGGGRVLLLPLPSLSGGSLEVVPIRVSNLEPATSCGGPDVMVCADAGWHQLEFSEPPMNTPPGGLASPAMLGPQALSVFNWGLRVDHQCREHGRWAVVDAETDWIFD